MITFFWICALIGGIVLGLQVLLMLIGFGGDLFDVDLPDDVDGLDADFDMGDVDAADAADGADAAHSVSDASDAATSMFRVLSVRTVVAAITFFGLGGLAADAAGLGAAGTLGVAIVTGGGAMYGVYCLMQALYKLRSEGTVRIGRAVGKPGTVYLRIPGQKSGAGKIQLSLQERTMEYLAMTSGDEIPTGAKVVVTRVLTSDTVEVEPAAEVERSDNG